MMNKCPSGLSVPSTEVEARSLMEHLWSVVSQGQNWKQGREHRLGQGFRTQHICSPDPAPAMLAICLSVWTSWL